MKVWAHARISGLEPDENFRQIIKKEIDEAIHDIRRGVVVDFWERLRTTMH
jgi:hypothetical protein